MSEKHTPGPWNVMVKLESPSIVVGGVMRRHEKGDTQDQLAFVCNPDEDNGGQVAWLANARLIAAAPEMLEALQRLIEPAPGVKRMPSWAIGIVRAAVAKAEGREP